jgi:exopolysaccharide production protein ExoQ
VSQWVPGDGPRRPRPDDRVLPSMSTQLAVITPSGLHASPQRPQQPVWVRDDRHSGVLAGVVWMLVVLLIMPADFVNYPANYTGSWGPGHALNQCAWLAVIGLGSMVILWRWTLAVTLLRCVNPFFLAFLLLAAVSLAWTASTGGTVMRLFRLSAMTIACMGFVLTAWHPRRFQNVVRPILTLMLVISLLFGLLFPELAIHHEANPELIGAWHGLASQKNQFGAIASLCAIFWFHAWLAGEATALVSLGGGGVALACILLSRSSTSLIDTVFAVTLVFMLMRFPANLRRYSRYFVAALLIMLTVYALTILGYLPGLEFLIHPISGATGKASFSGRTAIWSLMQEFIALHPVLGTGYGAFWLDVSANNPSYEFVLKLYFYPNSAHNGYLDVINELGYVGLFCLVGFIICYARQALKLLSINRNQGTLLLALCFQQCLGNLSESFWFSALALGFLVMMFATMDMARAQLELQLQHYFGARPDEHAA